MKPGCRGKGVFDRAIPRERRTSAPATLFRTLRRAGVAYMIANPLSVSSPASSSAALNLPTDRDSSGRDLATPELRELERVIRSGTLIGTAGRAVRELEQSFASAFQRPFAIACSSGTAAVHAALAALGLQPGDEVVTSPITDMGAILPVLYEGGLP